MPAHSRAAPLRGKAYLPTPDAAQTVTGRTSQHLRFRAGIGNGKLRWLVVSVRSRCSDSTRRVFTAAFQVPFAHPQNRAGEVSDSYTGLRSDPVSHVRFGQSARFSARVEGSRVTGTARATQTLRVSGIVCHSPQVRFSFRLGGGNFFSS